jgi:uncharacterized protein YegP (UPF0339 family)
MPLSVQVCEANGPQPYYVRVLAGSDILARTETYVSRAHAESIATTLRTQAYAYSFSVFNTVSTSLPYSWHATRTGNIVLTSTQGYKGWNEANAAADVVRTGLPGASPA